MCSAIKMLVLGVILSVVHPRAGLAGLDDRALPFSQADLKRALALRGVPEAAEQVKLKASGVGAVTVRFEDRSATYALQGRTGKSAARYVALMILGLIREGLQVGIGPPAPIASPPVLLEVPKITPGKAVGMDKVQGWPRLLLRAFATVSSGSNLDQIAIGGHVGTSLRLLKGILLTGSIGADVRPTRTLDGVPVSLRTVPITAGAGYRFDALRLEMDARLFAMPLFVVGKGASPQRNVLLGMSLAGRWALGLDLRYDAFIGLTLTGLFGRYEFRVRGQPALATERFSATLSVGFLWRAL